MKTTHQKMQDRQWDNLIQEESRIANELQRDHPDMPRSEALRLAYEALSGTKAKGTE